MRCPFCGKLEDRVVDSRESRDSGTIRRRRECLGCGRRFTTYEKVEEIHYKVVKIDGTRQDFDRAKLFRGLDLHPDDASKDKYTPEAEAILRGEAAISFG